MNDSHDKKIQHKRRLLGAQAVIASLEAEDVKYVFGYPGGQVLAIYDALLESQQITHVLVRHEQAATHAADGYARSTGKPGVVLVTSGPGATNTVTGIATAYMDSIPLVVICGQVETNFIGTDAFQEADITGITLPISKHSYLVKDTNELPRIIKEAFYIATTGRPGPVLIDIPSDVAAMPIDYLYPDTISLPSYKTTIKGNKRQINQAAELIGTARRPVLYVGGGVIASNATSELMFLAEQMQIPVTVTLMGTGSFSPTHKLALGMPGMHGALCANHALTQADLVIAVGVRFTDRVAGKVGEFKANAKIIHIDIDPAEIGKNHEVDVPIVGDAKGILAAINEVLQKNDAKACDKDWLEQVALWRREDDERNGSRFCPVITDNEGDAAAPIDPQWLMGCLQAALDAQQREVFITTEVGQHQMWAAQWLKIDRPRAFISSGGLGTMGFGLPAAMGVQIAHPDALVLCIAGDGSVQMNIQEMATIHANKLPVKVIVLNNGCLGMVRQWQELFYKQRYSATIFEESPDFVALAAAYRWSSKRIVAPQEVDAALEWLLSCEGSALLDIAIPQDELVLPMVAPGSSIDDVIIAAPPKTPETMDVISVEGRA